MAMSKRRRSGKAPFGKSDLSLLNRPIQFIQAEHLRHRELCLAVEELADAERFDEKLAEVKEKASRVWRTQLVQHLTVVAAATGAPSDDEKLRAEIVANHGRYARLSANDSDLHTLANGNESSPPTRQASSGTTVAPQDLGAWLLLPLILLAACGRAPTPAEPTASPDR